MALGRRIASIGSIYCRAMAASDKGKARGVDPVAARAALTRLARGDALPWLHGEIARRLVERLAPIRTEPRRIVEWWAALGGGDAELRAAYPRAERVAVEPDAAWAERRRAAERRPWWSLSSARARVLDERASDAEIGRAQLVWANMALHLVVDPPALFARWHALLEVEGLVVFSCLGPGTLRELRELYRGSRVADADAGLHRHARPRRHARRCRLRRSGARPGDHHPALEERRGAARRAAPARRQHRAGSPSRPAHAGLARPAAGATRRTRRQPTAASASASRSPTATASSLRRGCAPARRSRCRSTKCGPWSGARGLRAESVR